MTRFTAAIAALAACLLVAADGGAEELAFSEGFVRDFGELPVQEGGRVKPVYTFARFRLLQLSGRTRCETPEGDKLGHTRWLLRCLFKPEEAAAYEVFLIESPQLMDAISLDSEKKRGRFSYDELEPARASLLTQAREAASMDPAERGVIHRQLINLANNVAAYEGLTRFLRFAQARFEPGESALLRETLGEGPVTFTEVLEAAPRLVEMGRELHRSEGAAAEDALSELTRFLEETQGAVAASGAMALFPPPEADQKTWVSPAEMLQAALQSEAAAAHYAALTAPWTGLAAAAGEAQAARALDAFQEQVAAIALARGEGGAIPMELLLYRSKFFTYSLMLYILAIVACAAGWLRPRSRLLAWGALAPILGAMVLQTAGITLRSLIRQRPPVTTLYETILFVTLVIVAVALVLEWFSRQRIALSAGAFLGALGIFVARRYEVVEGTDTMPALVAVLDTNFWLAVHVTTIVIGYGAGILAAALAHVYLFAKLFRIRWQDTAFYRDLNRMTYGTTCFTLVFATLGTVLGGIWAAESWGRFWGWDPKENGALMIVLWELAVLHAYRGRYIRAFGLNMAAVFGGVIIVFAWFGVNLLGVGLHSYGFTSGIQSVLTTLYIAEGLVLLAGAAAWLRDGGMRPLLRSKAGKA